MYDLAARGRPEAWQGDDPGLLPEVFHDQAEGQDSEGHDGLGGKPHLVQAPRDRVPRDREDGEEDGVDEGHPV